MASVAERHSQNVTGRFYVDSECIDCDSCREIAPAFFGRDDAGEHSYVLKQPTTSAEIALCGEAMAECPAEAIGDDGE
ncbi:MAG: ferredoxin [Nitrospirae bacterium CG18_big_fil_WC_8_21_14_2_50_70_55]|nr:ferredoxin [Deltaproteobacteria bacterium]OIP63960.1 MAG: ferredoxin [Nitrospirae bacterium CG2_30_70_394]PIQ04089.1 MAG: ferredoxin [Nitrospirae bacterium CG18_big_fil_WC_8_21_14_2_50_70_55]PIU77712.1 MAG: ferredoxin [Nitrospirae bacterium CG06_land_8_20_14_3_00_70_43]PIW82558.1 MAG: ferredoxin [Nitrospirae bacterium CG_4_8_14_3_um_filter_70_85]PIX83792.1 MAG: ferredoxin [Nitrospirae bacterium CG_4_10_14_3_um_filter_70_108]PJB94783.1 MAG: ferredoxin [Nitrospirae bacterium CG_4_9_14_0_8_um